MTHPTCNRVTNRLPGRLLILALGLVIDSTVGGAPTPLATEHVDLRITYDPGKESPLGIIASNDDAHPPREYEATNCVLIASESARLTLPGDITPLGRTGDPLWVLPASQADGLLYLGVAADGIPAGLFAEPLKLRLLGLEGPGNFFLWQTDLGGLVFWMSSSDGFSDSDTFSQLAGGHSHANWGFTTSGVYRITFEASGRRVGETTNVTSAPTTFTFHVLPLPLRSPFALWQAAHWPGNTDPSVVGPSADPDSDGTPNLWEYLKQTDPRSPDARTGSLVDCRVEGVGEMARPIIRLRRPESATDVIWHIRAAASVTGPWTPLELPIRSTSHDGDWLVEERIDSQPPLDGTGRFYVVDLELAPSS